MRDPLYRIPIKYKLVLTMSLLYIVTLGTGGYLVTTDTRRELSARIRGSLETEATLAKQLVDTRFELARRRVEDFASDGFIRVETESLLQSEGEARSTIQARLVEHLEQNKLPLVDCFVDATLLDVDGAPTLAVRDAPPVPAQQTAIPTHTRFSSILPAGTISDHRTCAVTTPLSSLDGQRRIGFLRVFIDVESWLGDIELPLAANDQGVRRLSLQDPSGRSMRLPATPLPAPPKSNPTPATTTDEDRDGAFFRHTAELGTAGWHLELSAERASVMAPVEGMTRRFAAIGATLIALSLAFLFFPTRFLVQPILQLRQAAQEMTEGDEAVRVPETHSKDEIGDLFRAFNVMAQAVEERSQRLKDSAAKLERQQEMTRFDRDRIEGVIRSMQDGLFIMNDAGETTFSNAAGHALLERLDHESSACRRLLCADTSVNRGCLGCLAKSYSRPSSCTVQLAERIYEIHVTPLPSRNAHPKEGVFVSRDVTERFAQAEQQAHQERMYVVGELAAVVAHEMNNPLAAIVMFSQMLKDSLDEGSEMRKFSDVILRNADSCRRTVSSLLEMSAFPAPQKSEFIVKELLADVADFMKPLLEKANHTLEIQSPREEICLQGDENQLRQVLVNIVMNAVQANAKRPAVVSLRAVEENDVVTIEVEDHGPGIGPDVRDRIFEPFFSTKPPGSGTGLGLPTSRRIVEAHGGSLSLTEWGAGRTVFTIRLPRRQMTQLTQIQTPRSRRTES